MNSLSFSLASQKPTKLNKPIFPFLKNFPTFKSSSTIKFSNHHYKTTSNYPLLQLNEEKSALLKRRESIGLGLSFGFVNIFINPIIPFAAEAEETSPPCEFTVTPSGLCFCDKVVGSGAEAVKGQLIKAHYVGKLENGKVFDSSYNRGKPLTFRIGVGEVIKGWDQGILGGDGVPPMLAGGKRVLKLPPELAYGMRGAGCKGGSCIIPPDSVLLFDVEFIGKA